MIAKQRAQYLLGDPDDTEWADKLDIDIDTKTLSSGDVLIRSKEPLPAEECQKTEQAIDREYTETK